jgi:Ankyrin repeats (3 copies)
MHKNYLLLASCIVFMFTAEVVAMNQQPAWIGLNEQELAIFNAIENSNAITLAGLLNGKNPNEVALFLSEPRPRNYGNDDIRMRSPHLLDQQENEQFKDEQLSDAVDAGDVERVKELIKRNIDLNMRYTNGFTVLHRAVLLQNEKTATLLLEQGACPNVQNSVGDTPLHIAVNLGDKKMVKILLQYSANPNISNRAFSGCIDETPLGMARRKGLTEIVALLESIKIVSDSGREANLGSKLVFPLTLLFGRDRNKGQFGVSIPDKPAEIPVPLFDLSKDQKKQHNPARQHSLMKKPFDWLIKSVIGKSGFALGFSMGTLIGLKLFDYWFKDNEQMVSVV